MQGKQGEILERLTRIENLLQQAQPQPMTLAEAAAYLHLSKQSVYRLTSRSEIAHYKPSGKKIYFLRSDLDQWLTQRRVRPRGEE